MQKREYHISITVDAGVYAYSDGDCAILSFFDHTKHVDLISGHKTRVL